MEPTMMAGGCGPEVRTTPAETMKARAMPIRTAGRGGVIEPHAYLSGTTLFLPTLWVFAGLGPCCLISAN